MKVGIGFTVYDDFTDYITYPYYDENDVYHESGGDDPDYTKAIEELNKQVKKYVEDGDISFTYDLEPMEIILPIKEHQCGNIFGEEDYGGAMWDDVTIYCEVPVKYEEFDKEKFNVDAPSHFTPERIYYS